MTPASLVRDVVQARRRRGLVAAFDLDGTLAPIARRPEDARVPARVLGALQRLARRPDTTVGIISGRPIREVVGFFGPMWRDLWLGGVHGYERMAPGESVRSFWSAGEEDRARVLAAALAASAENLANLRIERKGPIVAVHLRGATPAARSRATAEIHRLVPKGWKTFAGRRVVEIRSGGGPTKADTVRWIRAARPGAAVLYAGDDATDEDAFREVGRDGFGVLVGGPAARRERGGRAGRTAARYRLAGPAAVGRLVERLARMT